MKQNDYERFLWKEYNFFGGGILEMLHIAIELNKYKRINRNKAGIRHSKNSVASSHFSKHDELGTRMQLHSIREHRVDS